MEAADRGEVAIEPGLVAEKENLHAVALLRRKSSGPSHLALLAVHELVAGLDDRLARPRVGHLLAHLVAARQRRRRIAAHLRTSSNAEGGRARLAPPAPALALPQKPLARTPAHPTLRRMASGDGASGYSCSEAGALQQRL